MSNNQRSKPTAWGFVLLLSGIAGFTFAALTISGDVRPQIFIKIAIVSALSRPQRFRTAGQRARL